MLVGLLYAPIVASEIMKGVTDVAENALDIELFEGEGVDDTKLLFDSQGIAPTTAKRAGSLRASESEFQSLRRFEVGGRTLTLRVGSSPAFEASIDRSSVAFMAVGGVLASFLMALAVWLLAVGRVRAERLALRMTADLSRLARVVQHTSNSVVITDAQLRINWVNAGFTRITGYTQDEALGRTPGELLGSGKTDPAVIQTLLDATAAGTACRVEVLNRAKDGREYWIDTEVQPTRDENGLLTGFMEIGSDITEQKLAQQQLAEMADRMNLAIEGSNEGLWDWMDVNASAEWWSPSFYAMLGYEPAEMPATLDSFISLMFPDHLAACQQAIEDALSGSKAFDTEFLLRTKTGEYRWFRSRAKVFRDADGRATRMAGSMQNIHDRKQAERELGRERQRLAHILEGTNVGTWDWNIETGATQFNERWAQINGHTLAELGTTTIQTWTDATHPDDRSRSAVVLEQHFNGEVAHYECESRVQHKDGHWVWVLDRGKLFSRSEDGRPRWMAGTRMDISERKQLDENLRRSNELMAGVLENLPCGLSVFDSNLELIAQNSQFRKLLNLPETLFEAGHTSFEQIIRFNAERGEYGAGPKDPLVASIVERARHPVVHRFERERPNGVPMEVIGAPMPGGGFVTTYTDISERKQAEVMLKEALTRAEQASVTKSQFLANMSHEIRTPMNAILGMLSLLQKTELTTRQLDYASKTEGAARSLLGLLNDILDFSKAEAGKMTLDPRPFRIDRVLRDLSVILSANVGARTLDVLYDIDPAVPLDLLGDDMRLQQVLINLGGNAIKFTSAGEVMLSVRVLEKTDHDVRLKFAMRDSGIGIAPENQARIFTGFSQAEASTTRRFGGTGLGLAICQRLVGLMGGELKLDSAPGRGSTFYFEIRLPLVNVEADALTDSTANSANSAYELPAPRRARADMGALRMLIVDDNASAREVFVGMAQSLGWHADAAASGAEAIALAAARAAAGAPYEAVFLDWQMPEMDGWETGRQILANARADIKVAAPLLVMTTGHGRETLAQRSAEDQAMLNGFLVKPMTALMLFDAVSDAREAIAHPELLNRTLAPTVQRLQGMRLLVVEDNMNNQQVAQELLSDEGALVTLADNGQLGVDAVAAADPPFDAVLMDLQMPVMDGYTATAQIRQKLGLSALPIIAMTANAMASDREACLAAGMNDHVGKPFDLTRLVATLLRHTGRAAAPAASVEPVANALPAALVEEAARRGIDLTAALGRMGGNSRVYLRTLPSFVKDLATLPDQLASHLAQQRFDQARQLMHTFKGLAATLGIQPLSKMAAHIESSLVSPQTSANHGPVVEQLGALVMTTLQDITCVAQALQEATAAPPPTSASAATAALSPTAETAAPVDAAAVSRSLRELAGLLRQADMRALEVFEQLQQIQSIQSEAAMAPLDEAMAMLDFDLALAHCQTLQQRFDT